MLAPTIARLETNDYPRLSNAKRAIAFRLPLCLEPRTSSKLPPRQEEKRLKHRSLVGQDTVLYGTG